MESIPRLRFKCYQKKRALNGARTREELLMVLNNSETLSFRDLSDKDQVFVLNSLLWSYHLELTSSGTNPLDTVVSQFEDGKRFVKNLSESVPETLQKIMKRPFEEIYDDWSSVVFCE